MVLQLLSGPQLLLVTEGVSLFGTLEDPIM
jgi:hypothetical protein